MKAFRVLPPDGDEPAASAYVVALVLSILVLGVRQLLDPLLGGQAPFIVLLGAPILTAWYGGLLPGWVALAICAVGGQLLFIEPARELALRDPGSMLKLLLFFAVGGLAVWLIATRRSALEILQDEHRELQRVQDELAVRERRVRQTFEASPSGMLLVARDGKILMVNREAERLFGYARDELVGMSVDQLVPGYARSDHAGDREAYRNERRRRAMGRGNELQALRKDGSVFHVQIGLNPLHGDSEGLVLASVLDMSEQRAAAEALRHSRSKLAENEAMFRAVADNIAQLAWMMDATGYINWYNRRWFEYTGTTLEEMKGWGWQAVHHPDHVERVVEKFRRHIASGEPWEDTFPLRGADGQYHWFLSRAVPLRDDSGRIVSWFGTNTDVTAQRRAEEALRDADRRKDDFIAVLAHELRNPLAPVRNSVEILKRVGIEDMRVARTRDIIDRQVAHMARLIDDLLDVSRIARGKLTLRKELCDVAAIVCQTAEDYRHSLEAAGQHLHVKGCEGPAMIEGDAVRLAQMVGNLLTNAARFNTGPGEVHVDCHVDEGQGRVHIVVADSGIGMDTELLSRLFDPFAQATQDIARSKGGLGLGLALTKGLAELHGGGVLAESEGPGKGARFTITLPLARAERPKRHDTAILGDRDALRILVIEDNPDAASTLGELLQLQGHEVELAYDGHSGIELARRMRPDVVISDIGLPGPLSGYDVGRELRKDASLDGVYLIALSGYADAVARKRCSESGFDAHLAKPPDIGALDRALAAVKAGSERAQEETN